MKGVGMGDSKTFVVNTDIGLMPNHWDIVEVNKLGDIVTGTTPKTNVPEYYGGAYMFIAPGDINHNKYVKKTQKYLSDKGLKVSRPLTPNTVLVVCIGATIGKVAITQAENSTTNQQINAVIPNQKVNADYLYYAFKYRSPYLPALAGRAAIPIVNKSNFGRFLIPLAPLPEQKTIAHTLQTIQKGKETCQRELELERERKAALMQYLFTHGTRNEPRKQTKVGEIPNTWKVIKFGQICESSAYGPRFSGNLYNPNGTIATLRTTDIDKDGNINYSTMPFASLELHKFKNHLIETKDLLITRSGTCGIAAVFESYNSPVIPGAFLIRFRLNEHAEPYFLRYYINSHIGRKRITQLASGAVQKNISGTSLLNWLIPLPTIPDQLKIVGILRTCDRKIQALEKELTLIDELFHAMLEQLMIGKISTQPLAETYV